MVRDRFVFGRRRRMRCRRSFLAICGPRPDIRTAPNLGFCRIARRACCAAFCFCSRDARMGIIGAKRMRTIALTFATVFLSSSGAVAHGAEPHGQEPVWTFDPWVTTPLLALAVLYGLGSLLVSWRTTTGRQVRAWRALAFWIGWLTLAGALVSPLHWFGEHLLTFHMIEHEILMAVSAPLLVLARPIGTLLWSLPRRVRVAVGRWLRWPMISIPWQWLSAGRNATLIHGVAIWAWHAPLAFDAAVIDVAVHRLQHLSFLLSAIIFWWSALRRSNSGVAAWHLFVTMLHTSVLGALMTLAPRVLYASRSVTAAEWGLTPLEDQQLAGLIMWVPAGTVYAGAALALSAVWIRHASETESHSDAVRAL
jgi:putative membrane protein